MATSAVSSAPSPAPRSRRSSSTRTRLSAASPASSSPAPGSNEARLTTAISGLKCFKSYWRQDHEWSWSKTFTGLFLTSAEFCSNARLLSWREQVTKSRRRLFFRLRVSRPHMNGRECGSSLFVPTPKNLDGQQRGNINTEDPRNGLTGFVKLYPTPRQTDGRKSVRSAEGAEVES